MPRFEPRADDPAPLWPEIGNLLLTRPWDLARALFRESAATIARRLGRFGREVPIPEYLTLDDLLAAAGESPRGWRADLFPSAPVPEAVDAGGKANRRDAASAGAALAAADDPEHVYAARQGRDIVTLALEEGPARGPEVAAALATLDAGGEPVRPYSRAERIGNALVALRAAGWPETAPAVRAMFAGDAAALAVSLEYHGREQTNNHLFNNGRALYLAGLLLEMPATRAVGSHVLEHEVPFLFDDDGFARENSSHYHLLLTRSLWECAEAAIHAGDERLARLLCPVAARAICRAGDFIGPAPAAGDLRLIGDVSPDLPPALFLSPRRFLDAACAGAGEISAPWWGAADGFAPHEETPAPRAAGWRVFARSGWFFYDDGQLSVAGQGVGDFMAGHLGHGHHHGGAFTLACRGEPILIDPGRATYAGAGETLAAAHNGIAIDGLGDHPAGLGMRFPADYSRVAAEVVRERRGARVALPGFARLRGVEAVSRTLVAEPGRFAWWDDVECARPVRLSSRLTLAPSVRAEKIGGGIFRLRAAGHVGLVLRTPDPFAAEAEIVGASWSPRYGVTAPTTAIACAARFAGGRLEWSLLPEAGSSPGAGA